MNPISVSMENSSPKVLALPPRPPSAVHTVALAWVGLVLGLGACATFHLTYAFPNDDWMERTLAIGSSFVMLAAAFIVGLRAVTSESKRSHYKTVVKNYSRVTGDRRYEPYILPTHMLQVALVFSTSILAGFIAPLITLFGGN